MSQALKERYKFVMPSGTLSRPFRAWLRTIFFPGGCPRLDYPRLLHSLSACRQRLLNIGIPGIFERKRGKTGIT
jgi:hypothetical protein